MSDKPITIRLTSSQQAAIGFAYLHPRLAAKIVIWKYIFGWIISIIGICVVFHYANLSDKHDMVQIHKQERVWRHEEKLKAAAVQAEHDRISNLPTTSPERGELYQEPTGMIDCKAQPAECAANEAKN